MTTAMNPMRTDPGTVLLAGVDDELRNRVHACLEPYGHHIIDAADPNRVFDRDQLTLAEVVLLNMSNTPDRDWAVLDRLQTEPTMLRPIVILLADEDDDETVLTGMRLGAHDQLSKPIRPAALLARVEAGLRAHRLEEQLMAEHQRAMQMSGVDSVTGLPNRRRMEELIELLIAAARRYDTPLSLVLADLDHFTRINEFHGSEAGDLVLREVGAHITADLRTSDLCGRWGDDEFLIVLPHTRVEGAKVLAERLRLTLSDVPVPMPDGGTRGAPASFGCAQGTDLDAVVHLAGDMMQQAKRAGGNVVRYARPI
jgi:two-component system, cell cycle response regulator